MATPQDIVIAHMACQITLNTLDNIKDTPYDKRLLKNRLNLVIPELIKSEEGLFYDFFKLDGKTTTEVYKIYKEFITEIAKIPIYDTQNLLIMYEAYLIDPKSMQGITNKVLKKSNQ